VSKEILPLDPSIARRMPPAEQLFAGDRAQGLGFQVLRGGNPHGERRYGLTFFSRERASALADSQDAALKRLASSRDGLGHVGEAITQIG